MGNAQSVVGPFFCAEIASVPSGYQALNVLTQGEGVEILEASPIGARRFLILALGQETSLKQQVQELKTSFEGHALSSESKMIDQAFIDQVDSSVIESAFSLTQVNLEESLVALECATVSGLLSVAHVLTRDHGLKVIETRITRSGLGGGFALFTGTSEACAPAAEDARTHLKNAMREGTVEVIEAPTETFRSYFNFSGDHS